MLNSGVSGATSLVQGAMAAKKYLDGATLTLTVNNESADVVMLDSFLCDDAEHSSKALLHKDIIMRGESGVGVFLVSAIKGSRVAFCYEVQQNGKNYLLVVNYDWDSAHKGRGSLMVEDAGEIYKSNLVLFKRSQILVDEVPFSVSVMITGAYLSISVLPK